HNSTLIFLGLLHVRRHRLDSTSHLTAPPILRDRLRLSPSPDSALAARLATIGLTDALAHANTTLALAVQSHGRSDRHPRCHADQFLPNLHSPLTLPFCTKVLKRSPQTT
ncbi:MAG: hypothetical protein M3348_04890, partial [Acidobacteriota bacterium]|nr:hypothetical protein [Acidobacteriota bacterium]